MKDFPKNDSGRVKKEREFAFISILAAADGGRLSGFLQS